MPEVYISNSGENVSRRGFFKIAIGILNGLIALLLAIPGLGYLLTPVFRQDDTGWIPLGPVDDFSSETPQKAVFTYVSAADYTRSERRGFVWVKSDPDANEPTVFSAVCTHTGCNVAWQDDEGEFVCPCHGGRYNIEGEVVAGPPPRALARLPTQIENGELMIQLRA